MSAVLALCVCCSLLLAQSLVDVAKKEKERRAKLKGKSGPVVTNEDLKKDSKRPKVVTNEDLKRDNKQSEVVTNEDLKKIKRLPGVSVPQEQNPDEGIVDPKDSPSVTPESQGVASPEDESLNTENLDRLEQRYHHAKETVEMLMAKMNGLFMKYYSVADTTPREMIQSEISRTYLQLQKAQDAAEKAKKELEEYTSRKQKETPLSQRK